MAAARGWRIHRFLMYAIPRNFRFDFVANR
jgi:hypothetical protein